MAPGETSDISGIAYFSGENLKGWFVCALMFHVEGRWRAWLPTEGPGQKFSKVQAWPAEAFSFGKEPNSPNDMCQAYDLWRSRRGRIYWPETALEKRS